MRNDFCIGGVNDVASDITGQAQDAPASIGLDLIQVGVEFDGALRGGQCDQHGFNVHESDAEHTNVGFTINTMRVRCKPGFQRLAFFVGKYPLIDERWALTVGCKLIGLLEPTLSQPKGKLMIGMKDQQP